MVPAGGAVKAARITNRALRSEAMTPEFVLTLSCPDRPGIVAAVATYLAQSGGNIVESQQFDDRRTGQFFMRVHFETPGGGRSVEEWRGGFDSVASEFAMEWAIWDARAPYRTLLMVSKFGHCLNDLLYRWQAGALNMEIPAIVSNHPDMEPLARQYGIPYHHIPVTPESKPEAEAALLKLVEDNDIHLVVLARYMQVLSDELATRMSGRIMNIHHSFLPSFKGAKPYHQAFARGVKLVGATAHYVTADLDEGPIIEQDVIRVDHRMVAEEIVRAGEEVEARVLTRALRWHCDNRVFLAGDRTVVFS
ncbi:Formyltetrahydrofolate deformylase [Nostocoides jenkinsii Ben 74]|uniref:Formyltetrahydrofolate deformylase n=2 Tax=Nostocoides jenkinsii TaxID=330834 RepID=A0A077MA59_9MICO|nr:Formyltetrahydrofolate deformylase [Tetrasphaera jenkinsii Ben 74]